MNVWDFCQTQYWGGPDIRQKYVHGPWASTTLGLGATAPAAPSIVTPLCPWAWLRAPTTLGLGATAPAAPFKVTPLCLWAWLRAPKTLGLGATAPAAPSIVTPLCLWAWPRAPTTHGPRCDCTCCTPYSYATGSGPALPRPWVALRGCSFISQSAARV